MPCVLGLGRVCVLRVRLTRWRSYGLACAEDGGSIGEWLMSIVEQRRVLFQGKDAAAKPNKVLAKMGGKGTKGGSKVCLSLCVCCFVCWADTRCSSCARPRWVQTT